MIRGAVDRAGHAMEGKRDAPCSIAAESFNLGPGISGLGARETGYGWHGCMHGGRADARLPDVDARCKHALALAATRDIGRVRTGRHADGHELSSGTLVSMHAREPLSVSMIAATPSARLVMVPWARNRLDRNLL